jgi:hypothetical protein
MHELFTSPNAGPVLAIIVMFLSIVVISVGCTIAVQWRKARQTEVECALKQEMIDRGMSADDILRVVAATTSPPWAKNPAAELAEAGMSADDIVKVLNASSSPQEPLRA